MLLLKKDLFHRPGFYADSWEYSEVTVSVHKLPRTTPPVRT